MAAPPTESPTVRKPHVGTVYLLHFSKPYRHAEHYVGFTQDLHQRLRRHRRGDGSALLRAVVESGRELFLARRWDHVTVAFERRVHKYHPWGGPRRRICPICFGPAARRYCPPRRDPITGIGV